MKHFHLMTRLILVAILAVPITVILSCSQSPLSQPIPPKPIPSDLTIYQIQFLPYGGDPRGTYYPNTPLVILSGNPSRPEYSPINPTINTGTGKLILSGSSPSEGTWRTENFTLRYDGRLENFHPISTVNHDSLEKFLQIGFGRWGINPNYQAQIVFSNRTGVEDFYYTVDSLGMYLYTSPPRTGYPPQPTGILVTTIFKKQK